MQVADDGPESSHLHPYTYKAEYDALPPSNTLYVRNLRERSLCMYVRVCDVCVCV